MKFVDVIARCLPLIAVGADAVPDKVLQDQHRQRLELVAQLLDVKTHQPVIELHARMVIEIIERAGDIQFQCRHNAAHLRFRLPFQAFIQIAQRRHILRLRIFDILFVDDRQAAVDHGVRFCGDVALSVHDDFAEGQNQLRLEPQHVVHVFFQLNIHRVDVIVTVRRQHDGLTVQPARQHAVLALRVAQDDLVIRGQVDVDHLLLAGNGLAAA